METERNRNSPKGRKRLTERPDLFAPENLERGILLEAMPENASGTDKRWLNEARSDRGA